MNEVDSKKIIFDFSISVGAHLNIVAWLFCATIWPYDESVAENERRKATKRLFRGNAIGCEGKKMGPCR